MWNWALTNVNEDQGETVDIVKQTFDALKPWLNLELWKHNIPQEPVEFSSTFIDDLKAKGASTEELEEIGKKEDKNDDNSDKEDESPGIELIE